jgi:hypothetical protein
MSAVFYGHLDAIRLLLALNTNAKSGWRGLAEARTENAARAQNDVIVRLFLEHSKKSVRVFWIVV